MSRWTGAEQCKLRALYPGAKREEVMAALPGKTWQQIMGRAAQLRVRRAVYWVRPGLHPVIERLYAKRMHSSISQSKMAETIGTSRASMNRLENGRALPHLAQLDRWCSALNLELTIADKADRPEA